MLFFEAFHLSTPTPSIQLFGSMLAEVLLSLSGHPSSLLNNENLNPSKNQVPLSLHSKSLDSPLHPSELESLSSLKLLSSRFLRIQTFSKGQLDLARRHSLRSAGVRIAKSSSKTKDDGGGVSYRCSHLSPLCSTLLSITREYQDLILDLQKSILERRNDGGFHSLNSIKAKVSVRRDKKRSTSSSSDLCWIFHLFMFIVGGRLG